MLPSEQVAGQGGELDRSSDQRPWSYWPAVGSNTHGRSPVARTLMRSMTLPTVIAGSKAATAMVLPASSGNATLTSQPPSGRLTATRVESNTSTGCTGIPTETPWQANGTADGRMAKV